MYIFVAVIAKTKHQSSPKSTTGNLYVRRYVYIRSYIYVRMCLYMHNYMDYD